MRGLHAIRWHSRNTCAICHAAASPHGNTKLYHDANLTRLRHTNNHANRCADGHAKPGPNRPSGGNRLRRAARQD
jgi:hypothetical protein